MKKNAQHLCESFNEYSYFIKSIALKAHKKSALMSCKAGDNMEMGYEVMAQINLDISESGLIDYLSALSIFESNLNGDDNRGEH